MSKEQIVYIEVSKLKLNEKNPRKNDNAVDGVAKSIEKYGFKNPLIIDSNNVVWCGNTRLKASKKLGLKEVPCIIADDLTEEQIREYALLDNKLNEIAEWDMELLSEELLELDMSDFELDWGLPELLEEEKEVEEDDFDCTPPEQPKAKLGDVYQLGNHRLMCGDSTKEEDVAKLMDGVKADMVFTDPPYGMNLDTDFSGMKNKLDFAKEKGFTGGKKYEQGIVDEFNPKMIDLIMGLNIKETFLWGADYFAELLPNKNDGSWIVWDKRANNNDDIEKDYSSDKMYGSCFELCWSKNKHKRDIARVKWASVFGTEQEFDHKRYHPTQKPIKLCEWFIKRYSQDKATLLDLFGGSGSTLIACEQLDRKCYMMELDPKYVDVIIARWEQFTGKKAEKIN
jgi:site-specific DNA-methyltransferase (adenine-specific)